MRKRLWRSAAIAVVILWVAAFAFAANRPVEFAFAPAGGPGDAPLAREIWAEVTTPAPRTLRLPAFYVGEGIFAVRVRAELEGEYRLGTITETLVDGTTTLTCRTPAGTLREVSVAEVETQPQVRLDPSDPTRFVTSDGKFFAPLGANLAWAEGADRVGWYAKAFPEFHDAGLNWTRVWMAHWGGLDPSWLADDMGLSPPRGGFDGRVAKNWDGVIAAAEEAGVYVQFVLQHHGQLSSQVNANWARNPWNVANPGGFLRTAGEFFTSAEAKRLTKQKYRTTIARWGYSPSIMAWELFNEVHWVDAMRIDHNEATVAKWHDEMAAYVRALDVYGHLVVTSLEDLASPIYRTMDFYQPHLYPIDPLPAARRHNALPAGRERPVFYGEQGDDNLRFTQEQRETGAEMVPIVWASLMGEGIYAAQPWEGAQMLARGRLGEMRAVARFLKVTKLAERKGLVSFSPRIESVDTVPLLLTPAEKWRTRPPQTIAVAADGSMPIGYGTLPGIFVGARKSVAEGYSDRLTLKIDFARPTAATLRIADVGTRGAKVRVTVDAKVQAKPSLAEGKPTELALELPAGPHELRIENVGRKDWFEFGSLTFDRPVSALAAIGRRSPDFVAVWLWQRQEVFALESPKPVAGELWIDDLAAGNWRVVWWDSEQGGEGRAEVVAHAGGALRLTTPLVRRHAAVVLEHQ